MKTKYIFLITLLLLAFVPVGADVNGGTESRVTQPIMSSGISTDQTGWYEEYIWTDLSPEGDFSGNAEVRGSDVLFDGIDFELIWPTQLLNTLQWGGVYTSPASSPDEFNLWVDFTFRTNDAVVAQTYAEIIVDTFSTSAAISLLEFQGSQGFDENYGDGWYSYTSVRYQGHVDWTNYLEIIDRSIPRSYGGIAETIDVFQANHLNFQFWTEGDNSMAASIGLDYYQMFESQTGGFTASLKSLIPVDWFAPSTYSNGLHIHNRLPEVSNLVYSVGNTSNTNVVIRYDPSPEEHNEHAAWQIDAQLDQGAFYSDITMGFDFEFTQDSWRNNEHLWWDVDARGYSTLHMEITGRDRAMPLASLQPENALFDDVVTLWLDVDPQYLAINGYHTQWLNVHFPKGYDFLTANTTFTTIINELETLGLTFSDVWNKTDWNDPNSFEDMWINSNQSYVPTDGIAAGGILPNAAAFETFLQNNYVYPRSAALSNTTLANLDYYNWGMEMDRWGRTSRISVGIRDMEYTTITPTTIFDQLVEKEFTVDLLDPIGFDWAGIIPWSTYSDSIAIWFSAPYTGDFDGINFAPDENNGINWQSNRWTDSRNNRQRFDYEFYFYDGNPVMIDYVDGQEVPAGPFTGASVSFTNYFYDLGTDLEAPFVWALRYKNTTRGYDEVLPGYPSYYRMYDGMRVIGDLDIVASVYDGYTDRYWDGSQEVPRYPVSGINDVTAYMYRTDAPIDHPLFTKTIPLVRNATWVNDAIDSQAWGTTIDTTMYPDGEWNIWADVEDVSGNMGSDYLGNIYIDNYDESYSPADVSWSDTAPMDGEGVMDIAWYNFSIQDDVGVFSVIAWNNLGGYILDPISFETNSSGYFADYAFMVDTLAQGIPENAPMTITIEVLDMDGHWSYNSIHSIIDNIPTGNAPTVSLVQPIDGATINNTIETILLFSAEVFDDWGVKSVQLQLSGIQTKTFDMFLNENTGHYEYNADISGWMLGDYDWKVVVIDVDENTHTVNSDTWGLMIVGIEPIGTDTTKPSISLNYPDDGDTVSGEIEIRADVTDDTAVSQVSLTLPSGNVEEMTHESGDAYIYSWDSASVQDDEFEFKITARDTSGNSDELIFHLITNNGRTRATPDVGLPGFTLMLSILALGAPSVVRKVRHSIK